MWKVAVVLPDIERTQLPHGGDGVERVLDTLDLAGNLADRDLFLVLRSLFFRHLLTT